MKFDGKFEVPKSKAKVSMKIFEEDSQNDSEEDKFHQQFIEAFRKKEALEEKERKEKELEEQKREKALQDRQICEEDIPAEFLNKRTQEKEDYFAK